MTRKLEQLLLVGQLILQHVVAQPTVTRELVAVQPGEGIQISRVQLGLTPPVFFTDLDLQAIVVAVIADRCGEARKQLQVGFEIAVEQGIGKPIFARRDILLADRPNLTGQETPQTQSRQHRRGPSFHRLGSAPRLLAEGQRQHVGVRRARVIVLSQKLLELLDLAPQLLDPLLP